MNSFRIALANLRIPTCPEESVTLVERAIAEAAAQRAKILCFPECFVPGYRGFGMRVSPPDAQFLEQAWTNIAAAAAKASVAVILGTERIVDGTLLCYQPYGREGLLVADVDLSSATGLLARRCKPA
jgi:predicted amidohydrolase